MPEALPKIVLAEDDVNLGPLLRDYLRTEGFDVVLCTDGEAALQVFKQQHFDLCLLDVMMPRMDGFTLAAQIKALNSTIPMIFITARSFRQDKQKGYNLGADDYITKPFDEEELLWKIRALVRRSPKQQASAPATINIGRYVFDPQNQSLCIGDETRRITEKETGILKYLSEHRNEVIRRETMLKELWGSNDYFLGRSLDVFITKLRKYLKDDPSIRIETVFGVGFMMHAPEPGH